VTTKHFYRLILRVEPGGSRKHDEWIAGTLAEIGEFLREDLESGVGAYHAICYGEIMELECCQDRRRVATVPVGPCVRLTVEGLDEEIWFDADGAAFGYDFEADEALDDEAQLSSRLLDEAVAITARIDWSAVALPELKGEPLRPGETAELLDPVHGLETMEYGHHMLWG
jgi:hypothetical protein